MIPSQSQKMNFNREELAILLKQIKGDRTRVDFCKLAGISKATYDRYISGNAANVPTLAVVQRIAVAADDSADLDAFYKACGIASYEERQKLKRLALQQRKAYKPEQKEKRPDKSISVKTAIPDSPVCAISPEETKPVFVEILTLEQELHTFNPEFSLVTYLAKKKAAGHLQNDKLDMEGFLIVTHSIPDIDPLLVASIIRNYYFPVVKKTELDEVKDMMSELLFRTDRRLSVFEEKLLAEDKVREVESKIEETPEEENTASGESEEDVDAWKFRMSREITGLCNRTRGTDEFLTADTIFTRIYVKMNRDYGIVWEQERKEYKDRHPDAKKPSTFNLVADKPVLRSIFQGVLSEM